MIRAKISDRFLAEVNSPRGMRNNIGIGSIWDWECLDKYGRIKWKESMHNTCSNEGLDALLNIMFHAATQITTWYVLLFESDTTPSGATTYAVPVFTESTAYDEAVRQAYDEAAASSQSITNAASKAVFTIDATKTIYGGALVGGGSAPTTKNDQAGNGTLFCASKFDVSKSVVDNDILNVTVTITVADT